MPRPTTNPIPAWSKQIGYNGPTDERDLLVAMARELGARSLSQFLKAMVARGIEATDAAKAAELRAIRRRYYGATLALLFIGSLAASWLAHEDLQRQCRRCTRRPGCRFEECVTVEIEEAS